VGFLLCHIFMARLITMEHRILMDLRIIERRIFIADYMMRDETAGDSPVRSILTAEHMWGLTE
jgi:hypothetical protein